MDLKKIRKMRKGFYQLSPDGARIAHMSGGTVRIYSTTDYSEQAVFSGMQSAYQCAFSQDGQTLVVKSGYSLLYIYALKTCTLIHRIRCGWQECGQDGGFCLTADGKYLINLVYTDQLLSQLQVYDIETAERTQTLFDGDAFVFRSIEYVPEKERYLIMGYERIDRHGDNHYFAMWYDLEHHAYERTDIKKFFSTVLYCHCRQQYILSAVRGVSLLDIEGNCISELCRNEQKHDLSMDTLTSMLVPKKLLDEDKMAALNEMIAEGFLAQGLPLTMSVLNVTVDHVSMDALERRVFISRSDGVLIYDLHDGSSEFFPMKGWRNWAFPVEDNLVVINAETCYLYAIE